jgi:hypothetical protein
MTDITLLEETEKYYLGKIDNKVVKLFKIDTKEMEIKRQEELNILAGFLDDESIINLLIQCDQNISMPPSVDVYEDVCNVIISRLKNIEAEILKHKYTRNICFQYIKQLDPSYYGKAQTFMKNIKFLYSDLVEIMQLMEHRGLTDYKLKDTELLSFDKIKNN